MKTKPTGIWATFSTNCATCGAELTVTNSRPVPHTCRVDLDRRQLIADWTESMGDYYDSGAIGPPPKHPLDDRKS